MFKSVPIMGILFRKASQFYIYLNSSASRSIKYAPSSSSAFMRNLPENIAQSMESGSFLRVSSVVLYILPPTFNLIVLAKWTRFNVLVISSLQVYIEDITWPVVDTNFIFEC